jgi:hypothetical protein
MARPARTALQGGEHAIGAPQDCFDPDSRRTAAIGIARTSIAIATLRYAPRRICFMQLKAGIHEFMDAHHENPKPFVWTKSADEILASIARFAQRTVNARAALQMPRTTITGH